MKVYPPQFNPLKTPCNWTMAKDHALASLPGIASEASPYVCSCCLMQIQKQNLPINFNINDLASFGKEYTLLYQSIKLVAAMILVTLFNTGIIMLHDSIIIDSEYQGFFGFEIKISPIQKQFPVSKLSMVSVLGFVLQIIIILFVTLYQRRQLNKQNKESDDISDYSILVRNIPKGKQTRDKVKSLFVNNFENLQIADILLIHQWKMYKQGTQKINQALINWKKLLKNKQRAHQDVLANLKAIENTSLEFNELKKSLLTTTDDHFSGNAIVVFTTKQEKNQVLDAYKNGFFSKNKLEASLGAIKFDQNLSIIISSVPNPEEIIWQNLSLSRSQRAAKTRLSFVFLFVSLAGFFLVHFLLQLIFGRKLSNSNKQTISLTPQFSPIPSLVITSILLHTLLPWLMIQISKYSQPQSLTQLNMSITSKLYISFLCIRFVIIFLVECIFSQQVNDMPKARFIAYSTIVSMTRLTLIDLLISTLINLINPLAVFKLIRQKINKQKNSFSQGQANQFLEKPQYKLSLKYSYVLVTLSVSFMLSDIVPITIITSLVGLIIFFWVEKLNISKRSSISPIKFNKNFVKTLIVIIQSSLVLKPLINLTFGGMSMQSVLIPQIFMILIAIAYMVAPKQILLEFLSNKIFNEKKLEKQQQQNSVIKISNNLKHHYKHYYPISNSNSQSQIQQRNSRSQSYKFKNYNQEENSSQVSVGVTKEVLQGGTCPINKNQQVPQTDRNLSCEQV